MRTQIAALLLACAAAMPALSQVHVTIGINVPAYPTLQRVPGYPVYYAPNLGTNYFFYDGLYWVYEDDRWFASSWYNGPWSVVDPYEVPAYVLRVPVRYYRHAPAYFRDWRADAPPRWEQHWGRSWAERRGGWDRWDRRSAPAPAPLPAYQRQYSRDRYPDFSQQVVIQSRDYRYQPREAVSRETYRQRRAQVQESSGRDGRGPPVRDERGIPAHAKGLAKGHDPDRVRGRDDRPARRDDDDRGRNRGSDDDDRGRGRGNDRPDKPDKDKKDKKDKRDKD